MRPMRQIQSFIHELSNHLDQKCTNYTRVCFTLIYGLHKENCKFGWNDQNELKSVKIRSKHKTKEVQTDLKLIETPWEALERDQGSPTRIITFHTALICNIIYAYIYITSWIILVSIGMRLMLIFRQPWASYLLKIIKENQVESHAQDFLECVWPKVKYSINL